MTVLVFCDSSSTYDFEMSKEKTKLPISILRRTDLELHK
jgi:hypothetical protein